MKTFLQKNYAIIFFSQLLLCGVVSAFDEVAIQQLPRDEKEAQILLNEGVLDSALWRKVEPFYTIPLCVPRGDLQILQDLFFSLPDGLPSTAAALSKYLPWDNAAQDRFFAEYPELLTFKPILSFEASGTGTVPGEMAFCFSRPRGSDTMRQYALFSMGQRSSSIRADGRVDFTREYGRWYRRSVAIVPHTGYRLSLGNFTVDQGDRLFYGYFPASNATDTSISGNWLYGTSRSWNGILFSSNGQDRNSGKATVGGKAFAHASPAERMGYGEGRVSIGNRLSFLGGISYLETADSAGSWSETGYFNCGFTINPAGNGQFDLQSGIDLRKPGLVPFDMRWSRHGDKSRMCASFTGLPNGFYAPRSALGHFITGRTGMGDTVDGYATAVDVQFTHKQSRHFAWTPSITAVFAGDALRYLATEIGASGSMAFMQAYRIHYRWSPQFRADGSTVIRRQGLLECSVPLGHTVCFAINNRYGTGSDGYWRYTGTIAPQFRFGRAVHIAPLFMLSTAGAQSFEKTAGIQQTLRFSDKTYSEVKIERQFPQSNSGDFSAQGMMSFMF